MQLCWYPPARYVRQAEVASSQDTFVTADAIYAGNATINGRSIKDSMAAIRQDLGVCPQFDILWPEISVKEHLMLYAAIKGFTRQHQLQEATDAAHNVGTLTNTPQRYFSSVLNR